MGARSHPGRIERRLGGRGGGRPGAVALGSDTGGSIRQPASLCGVVGFKPTYGRVSRYGLLAFGSSLDQIGPFSRTVQDAADVFAAMAGHDAADATTAHAAVPDCPRSTRRRVEHAARRPAHRRAPRACSAPASMPRVQTAIDAALVVLEQLGATLVDVALPHASAAIPVYYLVATAEASSNLARYDGVRYTARAKLGARRRSGDALRPHARRATSAPR